MGKLNVLDCTLREGGYVNDWHFGKENIEEIIYALNRSGIEFIECGFLKDQPYFANQSLFNSLERLIDILPNNVNSKYCLMINYGEVPIEFIQKNSCDNFYYRVAFKKKDRFEAIEYCKQLKDKGYKVFVNLMTSNSYSDLELIELIEKINNLKPYAFTISDTLGCMSGDDIVRQFGITDKNLLPEIALAFHSHNNMQLAFSNSQLFIEQKTSRQLIIDSTLMGIGRGAGNLSTEMVSRYLNFKYNKKYNMELILKIIENQIQPIYNKKPWGYSVPYYISALNGCHPNYAKYMVENLNLSIEQIYDMMQLIPEEYKLSFDKNVIEVAK